VKQQEESVRVSIATQIFRTPFEKTFFVNPKTGRPGGAQWTRSIVPVVTLFYDDLLSAKPNAAGVKPDGSVSGGKASLTFAFSPAFSDYRLILSGNLQFIYAFDRANLRRATFARESSLVKASLDYEFGLRSFEQGSGWVPSFGVAYTKGDDPLTGKLDQDDVVVAFKITYRSK
jgi:hypothetical protein